MNERKTENLVRALLTTRGYETQAGALIEEQQSDNPRLRKLLKNASKSGGGIGSPEFIITAPTHPDVVIVIECKADTAKHRSPSLDRPVSHACDGALLYASYLSKSYDVIAIGVSGETAASLKVSTFVHLQGQHSAFEISVNQILSHADIITQYLQSPQKFNADYLSLLAYSQDLNKLLHKLKVKESQREPSH